jgi:hypothetical protein
MVKPETVKPETVKPETVKPEPVMPEPVIPEIDISKLARLDELDGAPRAEQSSRHPDAFAPPDAAFAPPDAAFAPPPDAAFAPPPPPELEPSRNARASRKAFAGAANTTGARDPAFGPGRTGEPELGRARDPAFGPAGDPALGPAGDPAFGPAGDPALGVERSTRAIRILNQRDRAAAAPAPRPATAPPAPRRPIGGVVLAIALVAAAAAGVVMIVRHPRAQPTEHGGGVSIQIRARAATEVTIDGHPAGKTPLTLQRARGTRPIIIAAPGATRQIIPDRDQVVDLSAP